jgi:hypothetical protein
MLMLTRLAMVVIGLLWAMQAAAVDRDAASCSMTDVQTQVRAASNRDTVRVPDGSCTWTAGISTTKQIKIKAVNSGNVYITHSAGSATLFDLSTGSSFPTELSGINFIAGTGTGRYLNISGSGKPFLIHDNTFDVPNFQLLTCMRIQRNGGVIWNNVFTSNTVGVFGSTSSGAGSGCIQLKNERGTAWNQPHTMGAADITGETNVYIESNTFRDIYLQAIDCDDHARAVIRHNTFDNSAVVCHGSDTSTDGHHHTELYNNTFVFTASGTRDGKPYPVNLNWWWYVRGGTGVFTDNIIPDITSGTWGAKPELNLTIQNLRRKAGPYACCTVYPCPHQVGQVTDSLDDRPTEPFYIWNNTGTGTQTPALADYGPDECGGGPAASSFLQVGRDYVVGTAKPGYTKYIYPHPLRSLAIDPPRHLRVIDSTNESD